MNLFSSEFDATKVSFRVNKLREQIRYHDLFYYVRSQPKISDSEYDRLFNELQNLDEKYVLNFFLWMFSGGSYGKQKMDTSFDYLEPKYPEIYNLMVYAHENYLKTL